jgi:hypothetical protein
MPIHIVTGLTITPSITLANQFSETVRIKSNDEQEYFGYNKVDVSPNVFFPEFRLEMELFALRARVAFQAGYAPAHKGWTHTQFKAGAEVFYKNISLGLEYVKRKNKLANSGYSLEGLTFFFRFSGKAGLL